MKHQKTFSKTAMCRLKRACLIPFTLAYTVAAVSAQSDASRVISFGTLLQPAAQIEESQKLAKSLAKPTSSQWQAKGDQRRTYHFPDANADVAYRVCVPASWDGKSKMPLVMFLHGAGNTESSYLDQNNKQMVKLASDHGYILISPLGYQGAYGTIIRLPAVFGQQQEAQKMIAARTNEIEHTQQLSEKDVINVIELVLNEYPIDRNAMFITGHSMGSGGTWYIGAKYRTYWAAMAPMSGPFVQESGYAWDSIKTMPVFMTEGTAATSLNGSRVLRDWMLSKGYKLTYKEVTADHPGMVPLVLPDVFDFFDKCRASTPVIPLHKKRSSMNLNTVCSVHYMGTGQLRIQLPFKNTAQNITVTIIDSFGRKLCVRDLRVIDAQADINGLSLAPGVYQVLIRNGSGDTGVSFVVSR